jgi:hypothetical protein
MVPPYAGSMLVFEKGIPMALPEKTRKRIPVRRIVLLSLVFLVLLEPVVMFTVLQHQKAARQAQRAAQDASFSITPDMGDGSVGE